MPDRALRRMNCASTSTRRWGPNASNARQGIKTQSGRTRGRGLPRVRTPPMPDRALRQISGQFCPDFSGFVRTPPMPDRALRRFAFLKDPFLWAISGPNASNARQGIKTLQARSIGDQGRLWGPNASNARQGIKTFPPQTSLPRTLRSERLQCPTGH